MLIDRQIGTLIGTQTGRQTGKQTNRLSHRQTDRHANRWTDPQTDRQTNGDIKAGRYVNNQKERTISLTVLVHLKEGNFQRRNDSHLSLKIIIVEYQE